MFCTISMEAAFESSAEIDGGFSSRLIFDAAPKRLALGKARFIKKLHSCHWVRILFSESKRNKESIRQEHCQRFVRGKRDDVGEQLLPNSDCCPTATGDDKQWRRNTTRFSEAEAKTRPFENWERVHWNLEVSDLNYCHNSVSGSLKWFTRRRIRNRNSLLSF